VVEEVAAVLRRGEPTVLFLGGDAVVGEDALRDAARIAAATGARLLSETFPARTARGAGVPELPRLPYPPEMAIAALAGTAHLVLVGATSPVHFFAYPGVPGSPVPDDCAVHVLATPAEDAVSALADLAEAVAAGARPEEQPRERPELPTGALDPRSLSAVVGALLPEGAVLVDEALTSGVGLAELTSGAPRHDWLCLTGGAIGDGLPMSVGAAIGAPGRPVVTVQADGSAMYTIQALWTQAREQLDVTTVVCDNGSYAILEGELARVGAQGDGKRAAQLLDLGGPDLDFVALATGMGVPATRATTAEELAEQLRRSFAEPGPHLVQAVLPRRR
jgi:acetolactate synthase-1/2/3 large subunit